MRIMVVTDAWFPQTNGVVNTLAQTAAWLGRFGHEVRLTEPREFRTFACPSYPEIRLALFPKRAVGRHLPSGRHRQLFRPILRQEISKVPVYEIADTHAGEMLPRRPVQASIIGAQKLFDPIDGVTIRADLMGYDFRSTEERPEPLRRHAEKVIGKTMDGTDIGDRR